ncbi:MAG: hypothetical protein QXQ53_09170 [Candidatus Methanosuratincola sp.]
MLGAADDFVLELFSAIHEIIAVAGHPDYKVAVFLRVLLGIAQGIGRDHVELDVMSHQLEVSPDQVLELDQSFLVGQQLGREFLVEQRAARPDIIRIIKIIGISFFCRTS